MLKIEPAGLDDVTAMQAVERDATRSYGLLPSTLFCHDRPPRTRAEHAEVRATGLALKAAFDGAIVGFVLALPVDGRAHVLELGVARRNQRRGFGRHLMAEVESWARRTGHPEMTLTTFRDVLWNAPYYAKLGYEPIEAGADRPGLRAIREKETRAGLDRAPRIAMRKVLA